MRRSNQSRATALLGRFKKECETVVGNEAITDEANSSSHFCVLSDMSIHEIRFRFASDYYKMEAVRFKKLSRSPGRRSHIFGSSVLPSFVLAAAIFQFKSESGVAELSPFAVMPIPATALSAISKTKRQRLVQITRDRYMDLGQELLDNATWLLFLHC